MLTADYDGHNLVFMVGSPRSGTTWLQRMLACHPRVSTGQESGLFDSYIGPQLRAWRRDMDPETSGRSALGLGCYFTEEDFLTLLRHYMLKLLAPMVEGLEPEELFLEKTPSHAMFLPEIMEMLPGSRIIHLLRDARDVSASLLAASQSWGAYWAPKRAWRAARMWVSHVKAARHGLSRISQSQFIEIRYEHLYAAPAASLRQVTDFLGLCWPESDLLAAIEKNRPDIAKSDGGTPIQIGGEHARLSGPVLKEPEGFIRKATPRSWRKDLSAFDKFSVWLIAHKTMAEVGYRWALPW